MLFSRLYQSSPPDSLLRFKPALSIPLPDGEIISTRIYTKSALDVLSSQATGTDFSLPTTAEFKPAILITLPAKSEMPKVETATPPQQSLVYSACVGMTRAQCTDYARTTVQPILGVHHKEEERDTISKISLKQQKVDAGISLGIQQAIRQAGIPATPENMDVMISIIQPIIDAILANDVEETQGQMFDTPEGERQFLEIVVVLATMHTNVFPASHDKSHVMEDR